MKFHKKIAITSCLLLITVAAGAAILSSCSQGATPNLTGNYEYTIGSNKYKFNNNTIQYEESAGKFTNLTTLYDAKKYDIKDPTKYPPAGDVLKYNEGALGNLISTYLISICNQYLYLLTADPKGAVTDGGVDKEFELAYHLGMGEAKNTYRLRVQSLSFTMSNPLPAKWEYGEEIQEIRDDSDTSIPEDKRPQKLDITNEKVTISNIKMTFGYWKSNGGSSVEDIRDLNTIKNSNWQDFWREYLKTAEFTGITPTTLNWDVSFNKTLNFEVQPTVTRFKKEGEDKFTYSSTGLVNVVGLDSKNTNDPFAWPLWFDGLQYQKDDGTNETVNNVEKQKAFNNAVKQYTNDYLDGNFPYKNFTDASNPAANVLFNSLKSSFTYTPITPAPATPSTFSLPSTIAPTNFNNKQNKNVTKA